MKTLSIAFNYLAGLLAILIVYTFMSSMAAAIIYAAWLAARV